MISVFLFVISLYPHNDTDNRAELSVASTPSLNSLMIRRAFSIGSSSCAMLMQLRTFRIVPTYDKKSAGVHDLAPREDGDFTYEGGEEIVPGSHPLPLYQAHNTLTRKVVSPYLPSPLRTHPYFTEPVAELPHFNATVPIVYSLGTIKESIIVPVYSLDNTISHTRELDPFIFGVYPHMKIIEQNSSYWQIRCQNFRGMWDFETREIWRKAKKNWPTTGAGMPRASHRRGSPFPWGGRNSPTKPWNMLMPTMPVKLWSLSNRMTLTLKMLQGKVMIVDKLALPEPTQEAFLNLCKTMEWDVRHTGEGVLFMDGGSRLTPSQEFSKSFFYGSFFNGRCKIVRPTALADEPYDWNRFSSKLNSPSPKGQKNPVPINRFNAYDALEHNLLVITEGALLQMEQEMLPFKLRNLPPHIRNQLPQEGLLDAPMLGDSPMPLDTIEMEAAARTEEVERPMYEGYYDDPYKPWSDEQQASYTVDAVDGIIERHTNGKKSSWAMLE